MEKFVLEWVSIYCRLVYWLYMVLFHDTAHFMKLKLNSKWVNFIRKSKDMFGVKGIIYPSKYNPYSYFPPLLYRGQKTDKIV